MEDKIWFIFKLGDKHHQGPFSQEEVRRLHQQGQLPENTILWREGMKRWKPLDKCSEFNPLASTPQSKNIREALSKIHHQKIEHIPETLEHDLTKQTIEKVLKNEEGRTLKEADEHEITKESYLIRSCLGLAMIFLITFLVCPKNIFEKNASYPRNLSSNERRYLEQVTKIPSNKKSLFRMAINQTREYLWLAGNYKEEGKIFLTLTSKSDKTLSLKKVIIASQALFRNGYARFTHFSLIKGNWPIPGEYHAKIYLYPKDRKKQVVAWKGLFILPPKGKQSLSESLEHWKKNIHTHYLAPLKNQYQYYKTLKSHLMNMEKFYKKSFQTITWKDFSILFEQHYNREIGPLLQRFILDGRHLHLSLFNSNTENSKEYEKLFLYGKKIGVLASDMLTQTGGDNIKKYEKYLSRFNELIVQADSALKNIQEKINYYQEELPKH